MLERQINSIKRIKKDTEWDKYYDNTNYDDIAQKSKIQYVEKYLKEINIKEKSKRTNFRSLLFLFRAHFFVFMGNIMYNFY